MDQPDLIIFDLGRVLVEFDFKKVIHDLKRFSPKSEKEIRHYFSTTPLWDAFERGRVTPEVFFQSLQKDLQLKGLTFKTFAPLWNEIFREKSDTVAILRRLRGRYRLAMLSNVNEMHWRHIQQTQAFMHWFDHPVASFAVGHRKPDPEIYRITLRRAGMSPSQAIFIDDVKAHVVAAQSLGIRSYHFLNAAKLLHDLDGLLE
jgi:epoxide hydrolase-like predicted phosphatase